MQKALNKTTSRRQQRRKAGRSVLLRHIAKRSLVGLGAAALVFMSGCTTVETIDMAADRAANAIADLARLDPDSSLTFDQPLTLDDVIAIGLKNNLDLRIAEYEKVIATDEVFREKLGMLPNLNLGADYNRRSNFPLQNSVNPNSGVETSSTTTTDLRENTTANLNLSWNVLDLGLSYIRSRQAQLQAEIMDVRRQRQAQLLALELTETYWKAALAEDALDYVKKVEEELTAQKALIDQSVKEKRLDAIAAKEVQKKLIDIALSIRDLQADIAAARLDLARLMGLKQTTEFKLARTPVHNVLQTLPRPDDIRGNVDVFENYAVRNRPELFERDLSVRVQKDQAQAELLQMFPGLTLSLGQSYDSNFLLHTQAWSTAAAGISWNLLQLPARFQAKETAERRAEMAKVGRLQMTVAVLTQVHISLLDYEIAADRFKLREDSYELTAELLEMSRERNKAGILSNLAVTQRLLEDMATKLKRDQSVVDLIVAHRRLLASLGINPDRWTEDLNAVVLPSEPAPESVAELPQADSPESDSSGQPELVATAPASQPYSQPSQSSSLRLELDEVGPESAQPLPEQASVSTGQALGESKPIGGVVLELDKVLSSIEAGANDQVPSVTAGTWSEPGADAPEPVSSNRRYGEPQASVSNPNQSTPIQLATTRDWSVQLGAYKQLSGLKMVMKEAGQLAREVLSNTPIREQVETSEEGFHRGKFPGLTQNEAVSVCDVLVENGRECIVVPPVN